MFNFFCIFGHSWYSNPNPERMDYEEKCKNCGATRLTISQIHYSGKKPSPPPPRIQTISGKEITHRVIPFVPPEDRFQ